MFLIKKLSEMSNKELKDYFSAITPYNEALVHYNRIKSAVDKIYNDKYLLYFDKINCKGILKIVNDKNETIEDYIKMQNANACTIIITLQILKEIGQYITDSIFLSDEKYNQFYEFYYNLSQKFKYEHDNDSDYINKYLIENKQYENLIYINNIILDEPILELTVESKLLKKIKFMVKDLIMFYNVYLENINKLIAYYTYVRYKLVE